MPTPLLTLMPLLAQAEEEAEVAPLNQACGDDPGAACSWLFDLFSGNVPLTLLAGRILPAIVQVVVILAMAYVANRLVKRGIKRFVRRLKEEGLTKLGAIANKAPLSETSPIDLVRANMRAETIAQVLRSVSTFLIWVLAFVLIFGNVIGIQLGPLIAGAGIAGIALGFGAQNLVRDFLSGIFMLLEDQYGIGDIIDTGEARGTVEAISLRTTRIRDIYGTVWHIPNGQIARVGNFSQQWAKALVDVGVAYDTDIPKAKMVIKATADDLWRDPEWSALILEEPDLWGVQEFGPNELVIRIVLKTAPLKQWSVERELRARLKAAFDRMGIVIPFPQRTVWMHQVGDGQTGNGAPDARERPARPESRDRI